MQERTLKNIKFYFDSLVEVSKKKFKIKVEYNKEIIPNRYKGFKSNTGYRFKFIDNNGSIDNPIDTHIIERFVSCKKVRYGEGIHLCFHTPLTAEVVLYKNKLNEIQTMIKNEIFKYGDLKSNDLRDCVKYFEWFVGDYLNDKLTEMKKDNEGHVPYDKYIEDIEEKYLEKKNSVDRFL